MFVGLMGKRTLGGGETTPFSFPLCTVPLGQYYSTELDNTVILTVIFTFYKLLHLLVMSLCVCVCLLDKLGNDYLCFVDTKKKKNVIFVLVQLKCWTDPPIKDTFISTFEY